MQAPAGRAVCALIAAFAIAGAAFERAAGRDTVPFKGGPSPGRLLHAP
jgi:hypothetical protein